MVDAWDRRRCEPCVKRLSIHMVTRWPLWLKEKQEGFDVPRVSAVCRVDDVTPQRRDSRRGICRVARATVRGEVQGKARKWGQKDRAWIFLPKLLPFCRLRFASSRLSVDPPAGGLSFQTGSYPADDLWMGNCHRSECMKTNDGRWPEGRRKRATMPGRWRKD